MHIAIEVAHAPVGRAIALLASPNGSPTRSSTPAARMTATQASAAAPAATVAPRLTSSSRAYGARVAAVVLVAVRSVVVIGLSFGLTHRLSVRPPLGRTLKPRIDTTPEISGELAGYGQTAVTTSSQRGAHMRINAVIGSMTLALTATVLAACVSGDSSSSSASGGYCDELKADKTYFESLSGSSSDASNLDTVFSKLHILADDSPANVADDWKTLDEAVTTIESALKDAGIKASDLAKMQQGQIPPGADLSKLKDLAPKLQSLNTSDVSDAAKNISDDAKKTCDVDLTSTN